MGDTDKVKIYGSKVKVDSVAKVADSGVVSIEHTDFDGTERLALVLGADIVSTFDEPDAVKLGRCDLIEEVMVGEDKLVRFSGCPNSQAPSIVIRGANTHVVDEAHRSLHDALCVLSQTVKNTAVLPGGGATEMLMAQAVEEASKSVSGKQVLAMEAYAKALRAMPMHIADNAGYDSAELISGLRAKHYEGFSTHGLDMDKG